jgi:hypothetical protein
MDPASGIRHGLAESARIDEVHFPLMRLPTEIRQTVLKHLLLFPAEIAIPIFGLDPTRLPYPRMHVHLAVLRTCSQLHQEGLPILHSNYVNCLIRSHDSRSFIFAHGFLTSFDPRWMPMPVRERLSRVSLVCLLEDATMRSAMSMRDQFERVGRIFTQTPSWRRFRVEFHHRKHLYGPMGDRRPAEIIVAEGLQVIRGLEHVEVYGMGIPHFGKAIASLMMSNQPPIDFKPMHDAFDHYVASITPVDSDTENEDGDDEDDDDEDDDEEEDDDDDEYGDQVEGSNVNEQSDTDELSGDDDDSEGSDHAPGPGASGGETNNPPEHAQNLANAGNGEEELQQLADPNLEPAVDPELARYVKELFDLHLASSNCPKDREHLRTLKFHVTARVVQMAVGSQLYSSGSGSVNWIRLLKMICQRESANIL